MNKKIWFVVILLVVLLFLVFLIFEIVRVRKSVKLPISSQSDDRCQLAPDPGTCKAYIPRYYFDKSKGSCEEFVWGGCDGVVPFETLQNCLSICDVGLEEKCCQECKIAFGKSPIVIGPEVASCGSFSTELQWSTECKAYFEKNPMTAFECQTKINDFTTCQNDLDCPSGKRCHRNDCIEVGCLKEGEAGVPSGIDPEYLSHQAIECCDGLKPIRYYKSYDEDCNYKPAPGASTKVCTKCGDGNCGSGETICNCSEDC